MSILHCDADCAFDALARQAQREDRDLGDVAREIIGHLSRRQ